MPSKPRAVTVRGKRRWRIDICVDGKRESKTRDTKNEALTWAVEREGVLRRTTTLIHGKTMQDAFTRLAKELPESRKGRDKDILMLKKFSKDPIALTPLTSLTNQDAEEYMDRSFDEGLKNGGVLSRVSLLRTTIRYCIKWKWIESYPWDGLELPKQDKARTRLPTKQEIESIVYFSGFGGIDTHCTTHLQQSALAFLFSIETAMRQGEICNLKPDDICLKTRVLFLEKTKNGDSRHVPLSSRAIELLGMLPVYKNKVFGLSPNVCSNLFRRICAWSQIKDLHFHDGRAEATVRLSKKLDIFQLAKVTGHRNYNTLQIYYRESAADIAKMLD